MPEEQTRIRQIAWLELFPWLGLVRAARLAFAPRMLVLAALGVFSTSAGWGLLGYFFSGSTDPDLIEVRAEIETWRASPYPIQLPVRSLHLLDPADSPAGMPWDQLSKPIRGLFERNVTVASFTYLLLCGLWALLVWSLFGSCITRGAALWFAREDRLGLRQSLLWGMKRWPAYFGGPIFPIIGILIAVIPIALVCGLPMKLDFGVLLVGIVWPIVLLCGLFIAILLVGLLFGWPLMWPTVSAEGTDSFDALSRSYSYTYQRPIHYLFYAAVAGVLGTLAWIVVVIFAAGVVNFSFWAASWGSGTERMRDIQNVATSAIVRSDVGALTGTTPAPPADISKTLWFGGKAIAFWVSIVQTLAIGFLFSYFWCAATYIYFLLRQSVDATEMDEVSVEEEAEQYGLPPLQTAPGTVPQVAEGPPSAAE